MVQIRQVECDGTETLCSYTFVVKLYEVLVDSGFSSILLTATSVGIQGRYDLNKHDFYK